jgi:hypothetical protein
MGASPSVVRCERLITAIAIQSPSCVGGAEQLKATVLGPTTETLNCRGRQQCRPRLSCKPTPSTHVKNSSYACLLLRRIHFGIRITLKCESHPHPNGNLGMRLGGRKLPAYFVMAKSDGSAHLFGQWSN